MALTSEQRIKKMEMLAHMLTKLSKLYPKFADICYWEEAHILLAEFCLPEEERNCLNKEALDTFYLSLVSDTLGISYHEVQLGFHNASKSQESISL